MTVYDDVIREFREFKRYTGDGLPGAPVNAPLPIGDPQSGPYNPKKSALRLALGNLAQELLNGIATVNAAIPAINAARAAAISDIAEDRSEALASIETSRAGAVAEVGVLVDQAEAARDITAGYASDAVSQGNVPIYATLDGMSALEVPDGINAVRLNGRSSPGDGGGALATTEDNGTTPWFSTGNAPAKLFYLAKGQDLNLEGFGARANNDDFDNTDAINESWQISKELGSRIYAGPDQYWHAGTLIKPRWAVFEGVNGQTTFSLLPGSNCTQLESENFDDLLAAEAYDADVYPDAALETNFRGFVLDGNRSQQSEREVYGARIYGRRYSFRDVQIANQAGVGAWFVQKGDGGSTFDAQKSPTTIDNIQINSCYYENLIWDNPDVSVGSIRTIGAGDDTAVGDGRLSFHFPGEAIHNTRVLTTLAALDLNLNAARWGRVLHLAANVRVEIATAILAGGNGLLYTSSGVYGHIANLVVQANRYADSEGGAKPFIERFDNQLLLPSILCRRAAGQDTAAPYYKDSGGGWAGVIQSRNGSADPGHGVVLDASGATVEDIRMTGLSGTASDGTESCGLITTANAANVRIGGNIFGCGVGWKNLRSNLRVAGDLDIRVGASQTPVIGVYDSPFVWGQSLPKMNLLRRQGTTEFNQTFKGQVDFDPNSTAVQNLVFTHGLGYVPGLSSCSVVALSTASPKPEFKIPPRIVSLTTGSGTQVTVELQLAVTGSGGTNRVGLQIT